MQDSATARVADTLELTRTPYACSMYVLHSYALRQQRVMQLWALLSRHWSEVRALPGTLEGRLHRAQDPSFLASVYKL